MYRDSVIMIAALILGIILSAILVQAVYWTIENTISPGVNPEYKYYVSIRDTSNCTQMNDTYCREKYKICVHGYASCQWKQCPEDFP